MSLGHSIARSYRELQQSWGRLADAAFGRSLPGQDETARGEFISAFICEPGASPATRTARRGQTTN